ncbi:hypothetical protein EZV62_024957 [Acer yangbiense]|uniref:DUF4283 domain-containing protein n=1 Tax=Acer yangbiense TaxID=1000413 RepID=A0A5C7GXP5_9ROSI|nr:hypothetical protein EZV62_024957 [Acer yangbiense]
MNADEIARLCEFMSLKEQEGPVRTLKFNLKVAGLKRIATSLVGKVLSKKMVNREVFRSVMRKICFNDALIVMEEPEGKGDVQHMKFNKVEFWVQIHNAHLMCMLDDINRFLRSIIGDVVDIDEGVSSPYTAKFLRVRVVLEIDKQLRRCLRIDVMGDGVEMVMLLKYE